MAFGVEVNIRAIIGGALKTWAPTRIMLFQNWYLKVDENTNTRTPAKHLFAS